MTGSLAEFREERAGGRSTGSKEGASGAGEPEHVSGCRARAERLKTSEGHRRSWNKSWRPRRDHPCGRGEGRTVPWGGTPPSGDAGRVGRSVRSASASRILGAVTVERSISGSLHADPGPCQTESRITPQFSMNRTLLPPPQDRGRLESRSEN